MSKRLSVLAVLLSSFTAASATAGSYSVSECTANHNAWNPDRCTAKRGGGSCSAAYDGQNVSVNLGGSIFNGSVGEAYEIVFGSHARHSVNFGGLVRGMLIENPSHRATTVEVFVNHDSTGNAYTRYRCRQ
jgi:hypothetical protein